MTIKAERCVLFDWGDTIMRNFADFTGPMASWPYIEVIPEVSETLALLYPTWMVAMATNAADSTEEDIWNALQRAGLAAWFDKIYCFHNIGHKKPSPRFFTAIQKDLGLDASRLLMVGDSFEVDVLGANQSGIRAVWFNEQTSEDKMNSQHRTIHHFGDLPAALTALQSHET